ncbi:MAG: 6,7-dimethyl-8-ribityllumazine synthase [Deltaproteobacteria bacterium]|nr:6,7-dimethyl-8-ribityllumazine synthase [Deltaproteobacteria bacterium]
MDVKIIEADLVARGLRVALLASRFNHFIVDRLVEGATDCVKRHGGEDITLVRAPGAWELPLICQTLARSGRFDAVVALGAVIRGSTAHFDYVAGEVTKGLAQVSMATGVPVTFGVLTVDTIEQAVERAGTKAGNKGWEAAASAIEMANLQRALKADGF